MIDRSVGLSRPDFDSRFTVEIGDMLFKTTFDLKKVTQGKSNFGKSASG